MARLHARVLGQLREQTLGRLQSHDRQLGSLPEMQRQRTSLVFEQCSGMSGDEREQLGARGIEIPRCQPAEV